MNQDRLPIRIEEEFSVEAIRTDNVEPREFIGTLENSTTPSVKKLRKWIASGAVVIIDDFLDGYNGKELFIIGDGTSTVAHGAKIKTNTGANHALAADRLYIFLRHDGVWIEN